MKKHSHWLKIDGYSSDKDKQVKEIETYLKKYPEATVIIHQYDHDLFNKAILLECNQSYNDLDMLVNSGSINLRRLSRKPRYVRERKDLRILDGEITRGN